MLTTRIKKTLTIAIATAAATCVSAIPLWNSSVEYNLDDSSFSFSDTSVTFGAGVDGKANDASGELSGLIGEAVMHANFIYDPFTSAIDPLVTIDEFSFALNAITAFDYSEVGTTRLLTIVGNGVGSMAGYDDTPMDWVFTASDKPGASNYSATIDRVPDGGTTLTMLGLAIGIFLTASRVRSRRPNAHG